MTSGASSTHPTDPQTTPVPMPVMIWRCVFGGMLMGLANLVPGISGGTMLLAAGIYPTFIDALASVTRLKISFRSLLILGLVGVSAGLAVLLLAGTLKTLVVQQRWVMYSLFIGLTLGGVPVVWKMVTEKGAKLFLPAVIAFLAMVALAYLQYRGIVGTSQSNYLTLFVGGLAGASAMILPGLSGGYILLLLGQYVPILGAVDEFKDAVSARDFAAAIEPAVEVLIPVGIGVVLGIVVVGNLLKWLLGRYRTQTLGILLGLLCGSTVGLYPFLNVRPPQSGDVIKAQVVTADNIHDFKEKDWPVEYLSPTAGRLAAALGLAGVGFVLTLGVSLIGKDQDSSADQ